MQHSSHLLCLCYTSFCLKVKVLCCIIENCYSYINKAIYHHYIALSKAKRHQLPTVSIENQTDYDPLQFDTTFSESDTYNNLLLLDLKRALSTEEYHIIYDHYFRQYSIQEIATRDKKSRQAINKSKKIALEKLRRYWGIKQ